ncbi:MAG: Rrf2 family transcriptional regulator [Calditrichaeota bacterium]|nr:MAG: Rrf2 family transcriptional regulator [Calditrichota bacterium]
MFKMSKKVEYALISLLYMAERKEGELTTARELSENFNIPQEIGGKVLQSLTRNGFISSVQGVKGGYQLAMDAAKINVTDVIAAVDGPLQVVGCAVEADKCNCEQLSYCNIRSPMEIIQLKLIEFFNTISIKDLQKNTIPSAFFHGNIEQRSYPVKFSDQ